MRPSLTNLALCCLVALAAFIGGCAFSGCAPAPECPGKDGCCPCPAEAKDALLNIKSKCGKYSIDILGHDNGVGVFMTKKESKAQLVVAFDGTSDSPYIAWHDAVTQPGTPNALFMDKGVPTMQLVRDGKVTFVPVTDLISAKN